MNEEEYRELRSVIYTLHHDNDQFQLMRLINQLMGRYDE